MGGGYMYLSLWTCTNVNTECLILSLSPGFETGSFTGCGLTLWARLAVPWAQGLARPPPTPLSTEVTGVTCHAQLLLGMRKLGRTQ